MERVFAENLEWFDDATVADEDSAVANDCL